MSTERENFEAWFEAAAMPSESDWFRREKDDPDEYVHVPTQYAWEGWTARAARAALGEQSPSPEPQYPEGCAGLSEFGMTIDSFDDDAPPEPQGVPEPDRHAFENRMLAFGWRNFEGSVRGDPPCWYYDNAELAYRWIGWREAMLNAHPQPPAEPAQPEEMSPDFTDTARAALLWVLWHHQGGSSDVGQPIRYALGMGQHEHLNDHQVREARRWGELNPKPVHEAAQPQQERKPLSDEQIWNMGPGDECEWKYQDVIYFARAIEAAHGITSAPKEK